jgi:hypothetical protein
MGSVYVAEVSHEYLLGFVQHVDGPDGYSVSVIDPAGLSDENVRLLEAAPEPNRAWQQRIADALAEDLYWDNLVSTAARHLFPGA